MKKALLFGVLYFLFFGVASAEVLGSDLNNNGLADSTEADIIMSSSATLPAGEYFFNNLTITDGAVLTAEGNPNSTENFKGVKINAINLVVASSSFISADSKGYDYNSGPGTPAATNYHAGASYGGVGCGNYATSTYSSAVAPLDLGSGGNSRGGGAIMLVVSSLQNDGEISSRGGATSSGGSIYVIADNFSGSGKFSATGGGLYMTGYYRYYGGGGRIALHYKTSSFTGSAEANGGCGSLGMGYPWTCAGNGTVGFFNDTDNNFAAGSAWRFQKNDSPFVYNRIDILNGSKVTTEDGINISANDLLIDGGSSLTMTGISTLIIPTITISGTSTLTLFGGETLTVNTLTVTGNSVITVALERILSLTIPNITITAGSSISANEKGYGYNAGPGAPIAYLAGASYGGVGYGNVATSTYGSETEPVDFGSGGNGYIPRGGGAIRLVVIDTLANDGVISANGGNTSSGGSIYVTVKNLLGSGMFTADGGGSYCPNNCIYPGAGGRIAIYYETSSFNGTSTALAGMHCWSGCSRVGGNGTIVMEQTVQTIDPVIIIPGIMGSAYKNSKLIIDPILHTYDDLIATLKANGYEEGKDLFTFPYEWRNSNIESANLLKDKINEVKEICDCDKVDLVAHSMGGLVAREYIQSGQYEHDVDQIIFLGTPHRGSPEAYLRWEAGEFEAGTFNMLTKKFFELEAKKRGYSSLFSYIQNYPIASVQNLLPIFDYLKDKDTGVIRTYPTNYPRNVFLESINTNTGIQKLLNSGVRITNIIGNTGASSTIEKIRVEAGSNPLWIDGKPDGFDEKKGDRGLEKGSGDGTVIVNGSTLDNSIANQEISSVHRRLPTIAEAKIFNILTNKTATTTFDHNYGIDVKVLLLQLLSPVDMVITDPSGNRIGKNMTNGEEYDEIPEAFYSGYQTDQEYIVIPNPLDGNYKIEVQGIGNGGEYAILTNYISDNFATTTETTGVTKPNQITELDVVVNNQNPEQLETERKITPELLLGDINEAYDLGWIKNTKTRDSLIKQINLAIKFSKKVDIIKERQPDRSVKEKRIERFEVKVNKILIKLFTIELQVLLKKKMITQDAYNLIKSDVEYLINN